MRFLPLLISASLLFSKEPLTYFTTGATISTSVVTRENSLLLMDSGIDLSIGRRGFFHPHFSWDANLGLNANPLTYQQFYTKGSLLYFFSPYRGVYLGAGLACCATSREDSKWVTDAQFPLTLGYQALSGQFVQAQWINQATTLSFGISF